MLEGYIVRLQSSQESGAKGQIIKELQSKTGWSRGKVYRELAKAGYKTGRRRRGDAGRSKLTEEQLIEIASLQESAVRDNGKATMGVELAAMVYRQKHGGLEASAGTISRKLREQRLNRESRKTPSPHTSLRTEYPNQCHQVDPSLCMLYYAPDGTQRVISDKEAYKNKPFMEKRVNLKLWRYVLVDHYSASLSVRYYQQAGESQKTLYNFLIYAWGPKADPLYQFHGVPEVLVWDAGSANTSQAIKNALNSLDVRYYHHMPGNPRAKGAVEKGNDIVEIRFESLLRLDPAASVDELNSRVEEWCAAYNANQIEGLECRCRRRGVRVNRLEAWRTIPTNKLRELPKPSLLSEIFTVEPATRKVAGDLTISYRHPIAKESLTYSLSDELGIWPGMTVRLQPVLYKEGYLIKVTWQSGDVERVVEVEPLLFDEAGFRVDAPIIGKECKQQREGNCNELHRRIGDKKSPFNGTYRGIGIPVKESHTTLLPLKGNTISTTITAPSERVTVIEAATRLKARLGYWNGTWLKELKERYPYGLTFKEIEQLYSRLKGGEESEREVAGGAG